MIDETCRKCGKPGILVVTCLCTDCLLGRKEDNFEKSAEGRGFKKVIDTAGNVTWGPL